MPNIIELREAVKTKEAELEEAKAQLLAHTNASAKARRDRAGRIAKNAELVDERRRSTYQRFTIEQRLCKDASSGIVTSFSVSFNGFLIDSLVVKTNTDPEAAAFETVALVESAIELFQQRHGNNVPAPNRVLFLSRADNALVVFGIETIACYWCLVVDDSVVAAGCASNGYNGAVFTAEAALCAVGVTTTKS